MEISTKRDWLIYGSESEDPAIKYREMLNDQEQCPPWRNFRRNYPSEDLQQSSNGFCGTVPVDTDERGVPFVPNRHIINMVNAALYLRRPLLVVGEPGIGKSTLIYSVAQALKLGPVLRWGINSRSTRQEGLYQYDAIGRLQAWQLRQMDKDRLRPSNAGTYSKTKNKNRDKDVTEDFDISDYLTLGPVGTAMLPYEHPRALLIDEIDKGDPDLANDLLDLLEEGQFRIPELARIKKKYSVISVPTADGYDMRATIVGGEVRCLHFPVVMLTSNGYREFPAAFRRRCLHLELTEPSTEESLRYWSQIVEKHLPTVQREEIENIAKEFIKLRKESGLRTTDQLMQAVFLLTRDFSLGQSVSEEDLLNRLLPPLN